VPAQVSIIALGPEASASHQGAVACDSHGGFSVAELPAGRYAFTVVAAGYLPERFERQLPHRGELRGVRINLQPLRAEILCVYRQVAASWLPEPRLLDTWTPRELCGHVGAFRPLPEALSSLTALTALVEESYYSPRGASEADLALAVRLAGRLAPAPH
ncbi:MAG: carboxypeptidase regulatory-like domain-containing protein, partial [Myxococcales bacterium]|nr:carboxypeptidase regulatory-like domain-containing protein [Myxococcales bacterium]